MLVDQIRIDGGTQPRASIHNDTVAEYAEALTNGASMPPVIIFFDGVSNWLADGFHRFHAHKQAGLMEINAEVRSGSQRDAVLFSLGANATHGLKRTNEDKRKAVTTALRHPEFGQWSDNQISKVCGVSHPFVATVRSSLETDSSDKLAERTYTTKHGTKAKMKVANIGGSKSAESEQKNRQAAAIAKLPKEEQAAAIHKPMPKHNPPAEKSEDEEYTETDALRDQVSELQIEIMRLKLLVPAEADDGNEMLEELKREITLLQKANKAITESRDRLQAENAELKKQCAWMRKKLKG